MTTNPTPTTHATKAEAARQAARSSGLGSPAAMYFLGVAQTHALLEVAEQLRIHNLIALASSNFPHVEIEADDNIAPAEAADALVAYREEPGPEPGHGGPSDSIVIAALRPDVAATLGVGPLDEQEQQ